MQAAEDLLRAGLCSARRRYLLPPLPADLAAARAAGTETALAFAIEATRVSLEAGRPAPDAVRDLFTSALAAFLREALRPHGGDPAFQALVLQAQDAQVHAFVQLSAHAAADRRAVRSGVDAIAHPGKTRSLPASGLRDGLARLHALAIDEDWAGLQQALEDTAVTGDSALRTRLDAIRTGAPLQRLADRTALLANAQVQRYLALCERRGPSAGSRAAAARGRSAARAGDAAEAVTIEAFAQVARLLQARTGPATRVHVARSLRPPAGFPGERRKAKDEWDAAIVCDAHLLLLAEVKASPAAASSDFSRLHRGLERLAQAHPGETYAFATPDGAVRITGAALRQLQPAGRALPWQVIYCCTAADEGQPSLLAAASKAVLAAEPASLAYAQQIAAGAAPAEAQLLPVWEALTHAPRLRATLHQDATARLVRAAMLHPDDLVAAVEAA